MEDIKGPVGREKEYEKLIADGKLVTDPSIFDLLGDMKAKFKNKKLNKVQKWKEDQIFDFFGNEVKVEDRGIRYCGEWNKAYYIGFKVKKIDLFREKPIGILSDGNTVVGWTTPNHIIIQSSFKILV